MSRFLPVAVMVSCGDLVRVRGWKTERQASRGPLMHYQHPNSNPLFKRMHFVMVPTWCQD